MTRLKKETNVDCPSRGSPSWQEKAHRVHTIQKGELLPAGLQRYTGFAYDLSRGILLASVSAEQATWRSRVLGIQCHQPRVIMHHPLESL